MKKNFFKIKYFLSFIFFIFAFQIPQALADAATVEKTKNLGEYLKGIYTAISEITIAAAGLMLVLGAVYYMVSAGDKNKVAKARKYLEAAVIALLVVASAYLFFMLLSPDLFGKTP